MIAFFSIYFFISNRYSAQEFGEVKKLAQGFEPGPTVDASLKTTHRINIYNKLPTSVNQITRHPVFFIIH